MTSAAPRTDSWPPSSRRLDEAGAVEDGLDLDARRQAPADLLHAGIDGGGHRALFSPISIRAVPITTSWPSSLPEPVRSRARCGPRRCP